MLSHSKPPKNISLHRQNPGFWNSNNIVLSIVFFLVLLTCGITTFSTTLSSLFSAKESHFPTSIPWIDNQAECQHTNRSWYDNKCWDDEQSPMF